MTEKFEANSKPMRIHVSDPCKMLLDDRYVLEERTGDAELADKVCLDLLLSSRFRKTLFCAQIILMHVYSYYRLVG